MDSQILPSPTRRNFLLGAVPLCALGCFGCGEALGMSQSSGKAAAAEDAAGTDEGATETVEEKHKFDRPYKNPISNRMFYWIQHIEFIKLAKALEKEWGKDKLIAFLKKATDERMLVYGQKQAKQAGRNDFSAYMDTFRNPAVYADSLTMKIVEDSEKAFELEVTECIWATTFLHARAGDIGHAHVCYGDYSWARGFNPKIKLVRDKTLMQGAPVCNHRYVME